jgi:hypothetical protein
MQQHILSRKSKNLNQVIEQARISFDCFNKKGENVENKNYVQSNKTHNNDSETSLEENEGNPNQSPDTNGNEDSPQYRQNDEYGDEYEESVQSNYIKIIHPSSIIEREAEGVISAINMFGNLTDNHKNG